MADILDNKLAVIEHHAKEARAILDDDRADMRRECEARVALAVAELDAAMAELATERRVRHAMERAAVEPTPTPSNARVATFDTDAVADAFDRLVLRRTPITVSEAVALQALLGNYLPEGAIVIEGSSPLDPEERTETGPWVVAMSEAAEFFASDGRAGWDRLCSAKMYHSKQAAVIEAGGIGGAVVLTHAEALEVARER